MPPETGSRGIDGQYSVGAVGAGHIAMHYHFPILEHLDATSISFVGDQNSAAVERAADVYDTEGHVITDVSSLPDCDVALLALPVTERGAYVREFGSRGTDIFSEKPFAIDAETHEQYLDITGNVTCNYTRMEYGSSKQMAGLLDSGIFGELGEVVVRRGTPQTATGKVEAQTEPRIRGGSLHEHGTHLFSQLLRVMEEFEFVVEDAEITWNQGIDIDVEAEIQARRGDRRVPIDFEFSLVRPLGREIRFEFENASVRYDPSQPDAALNVRPKSASSELCSLALDEKSPRNHHQAMTSRWVRFLTSIESGELDPRYDTGLQISEIISSIYGTAEQWPGGAE